MTTAQTPPPQGTAAWKLQPERSNRFWLKVMSWISLKLGRGPSRVVLVGVVAYFLVFSPAARRMSRRYLQRVFTLQSLADVGWGQLFRHFWSFASVIHDRVYWVNDRYALFDIRVHKQNLIDQHLDAGQGVFLIGAHLGSFEVLRALGRLRPGLRIAMAMYEENARKINAALSAINPNAQQGIIGLGHIDSMIQVHALLAQGGVVGMLGDRSLGKDATRPLDFLGAPAELPLGPFRMAAIMKCPVLFVTGLYRGGNRYDIHFEPLADFSAVASRNRSVAVHTAMERFTGLMTHYCHLAPYNWFNFFDFWQVPAAHPPTAATTNT